MKKNVKFWTIIFIMMLSVVSCNKEPEVVINFDATTTASENGDGTYSADVDEAITFTDWSTGVDSRTWIFPKGTPSNSTEQEVLVTFSEPLTDTCSLEVVFSDGTTESKEFIIIVGGGAVNPSAEGYSDRDIFSFEDETKAMAVWAKWENDGAADFSIDGTQGADGTSSSAKVSFTTAGEVQIFTNEATENVNAKMEKQKLYVFSFWAKASETTTITAALENNSEDQEWHNYLWQDKVLGTDWVKYSFNIDPSGQPYDIAENVYIKIKMAPENVGTDIWLDEFSLRVMVLGAEEYTNRDAFSFEDAAVVSDVWAKWEADGVADFSVDDTQGANSTSSSAKVSFTTAGEVQIFTNQSTLDVNATVDKTKIYLLSFWAKSSEACTITTALENPDPWVSFLWQDQVIGTDWAKYSFDIDPGNIEYEGIADKVYVKIKMVPENGSTVIWVDEFSLKEKTIL